MNTIIIQPKPNNNKPPAAAQTKPAQAKPSQTKKFEDYRHEYLNVPVTIKLATNEVVSAVVLDGSRYWLKVRLASGEVMYINKAFVVSVTPATGGGKDAARR